MRKYIFNTNKVTLLLFILLLTGYIQAQNHTISGYVRDADSGEELIGANVYFAEIKKGTATNQYGFYSITVEEGNYTLKASFLGYNDYSKSINFNKDIKLNINLKIQGLVTEEVEIKARRKQNIESTQMGIVKLPVSQIKELPALMGEVDIVKTIQLLPGVQAAGEGNAGFYVRGGGPDQNLILLDEAVVYNASHLFGFFSVFNADAIKDVNLIKGGMPAKYGGRLSSVLDITAKNGNMKSFHAEGGLGLISSRLTLEGPIKKDTCSFIISGRRTYIDLLLKPLIKEDSPMYGSGYFFYDLNTKLNYKFSDKSRLFLSGYFGRDVFSLNNAENDFKMRIPWGNATVSARWNYLFNNKLFMNNTLIFTDYNFDTDMETEGFKLLLYSGIKDYNYKTDFTWLPNVNHNIKFGLNYTRHIFTPGSISAEIDEVVYDQNEQADEHAHEAALYISDDFDISDKLKLNIGVRATGFMQVGPFDRYLKNEENRISDTIIYNKGEKVAEYKGVEPRLALRYSLSSKSSLKLSFVRNYQYLHLATLSGGTFPNDMWVPSSSLVKPQIGIQGAIGYFRNFDNDKYETSIEVYYKDLKNLIEYKEGAVPGEEIGDNADNNFVFGSGYSYGAEFFVKKSAGDFTGWIGYTWSKTMREFPDINNGKPYPAKYDRRNDLSVTLSYKPNKKWLFSCVFVYATGNAITLPVSRYFVNGRLINEYSERNAYRYSPYHRFDLSATLKPKKVNEKYESFWVFSIYNVYSRKNPYFIYFDHEGNVNDGSFRTKAVQVSLFPILPAVTWNFKF